MTFDELQREYHEELNGFIRSVRHVDGFLHIVLTCDDWRGDGRLEIELRCDGAVDWTVTPSPTGILSAVNEHPMLWEYNSPHMNAYFTSAPANAFELSGRLREALYRICGRFGPRPGYVHASAAVLASGSGMLGRGPRQVVNELVRVATPYIRCSTVAGHTPEGGFQMLEFDDCYAICKAVALVSTTATPN